MPVTEIDAHGRIELMRNFLPKYVGPIVVTRNDSPPKVGSGVVLRIEDRNFLLTAAHVVDRGACVGLLTTGQVDRGRTIALSPRRAVLMGGQERSSVDVAAIELDDKELDSWHREAFPLSQVVIRALLPNELVFLHGYPGALYRGDIDEPIPEFMTFLTANVPAEQWADGYLPLTHHVLRYPSTDENLRKYSGPEYMTQNLPNPQGISGSGVWAFPEPTGILSTKNVQLVGIQYAWLEPRQQILANNIHLVLQAIRTQYPELASSIDSVDCWNIE